MNDKFSIMKKQNESQLELFQKTFSDFGFTEIECDEKRGRVSGKKIIKFSSGETTSRIYFYERRDFYDINKVLIQSVPAITLYLSGSGLRSLGIENLQLKYIKNPITDDVKCLDEYAQSLLILLEG